MPTPAPLPFPHTILDPPPTPLCWCAVGEEEVRIR